MSFNDFNLTTPLRNALDELGYTEPTTIQEKAFSVVMSGADVIGIAQTGTGKTLAYLLPCLRQIKFNKVKVPQLVIVVPTRELVVQVVEVIEQLTKYTTITALGVYGGASINTQGALLREGVDVVVSTPGRMIDFLNNGALYSRDIKKLVIDEVDEMLNLGFRFQVVQILELIPSKRQHLMFSATLTEEVEILIDTFFSNPIKIEAAPSGTPLDRIDQKLYYVPNFNTKVSLLCHLIENESSFNKVIVFTESKKLADALYNIVNTEFVDDIGIIHSNKAQNHRFNTVNKFKEGTIRILIATEIIARGLDISEVSHVINFDTPEFPEDYIHRIGRTGRAENKGIAISFITPKDEERLSAIETLMQSKINVLNLPENVALSEELTDYESPKIRMKNIQLKYWKLKLRGEAFHDKKDKNKKINIKVTRVQQLKLKYKKPKTRGQKK